MKVHTNLSPDELRQVGNGLTKLAGAQQVNEFVPENAAESELLRRTNAVFDTVINSLQAEFTRILLDKDE